MNGLSLLPSFSLEISDFCKAPVAKSSEAADMLHDVA